MSTNEQSTINLGYLVIFTSVLVIAVIGCCQGIHRQKSHQRLGDMYAKFIRDAANKPVDQISDEEARKIKEAYVYLKTDNWANLSNMLWEPFAKSHAATIMHHMMFEQVFGRTLMAAQLKLNNFLENAMATLLAFRINSFINYVISVSDAQAYSEVTMLGLTFAFTIFVIVLISQTSLYLQSKMHSPSIIAPDAVDNTLDSMEQEGKP